ncbi:MAG: cell division topological specificity factor MinE [Clostridia bacterium]|nr:cell division topological specificity factor MinE [Clostridia bacterium]
MMKQIFCKEENISGEINDGSSNIAKKRLINAINCERTHLSYDVNAMMQQDIKKVIENYLGSNLEDSDLIVEIKTPDCTVVSSSEVPLILSTGESET